jgi:hypothetical protein
MVEGGLDIRWRRLMLGAVATAIVVIPGARVHAAGQARGCPPAFIGPVTFEDLKNRWPPPSDLPDPDAVLASYDKNGDGLLCVQEAPAHAPSPINVIDNRGAT